MAMFNWFSRQTTQRSFKDARRDALGASRVSTMAPSMIDPSPHSVMPAPAPSTAHRDKEERMARRDMLFNVVREAMISAGILSSSYKFKVLAFDKRGMQFLVMVDLTENPSSDSGDSFNQLSDIEIAIAQRAKSLHGISVKAVYWRRSGGVATTQLSELARDNPSSMLPPGADPIGVDELQAFQRAMKGEPSRFPAQTVVTEGGREVGDANFAIVEPSPTEPHDTPQEAQDTRPMNMGRHSQG